MKKTKIIKYDPDAPQRAIERRKAECICVFIDKDGNERKEMIYPTGEKYYI